MCLENISEKKTATEDIVCYKKVRVFDGQVDLSSLKSGDTFIGKIKDIQCEGKISIEDEELFFCTDDIRFDGQYCQKKFGYKYSWQLDNKVKSILINGKKLKIFKIYKTVFQYFEIQIGKSYTSKLKVCEGNVVTIGLHTYKNFNDIYCGSNQRIVECIISKGSKYYEGLFNDSESYASNNLKYIKFIKKG